MSVKGTPNVRRANIMNAVEMENHIRWLDQKFQMHQDVLLLGLPGPLRRNLITHWCSIRNKEIEYICITRDTTESDLKQRRELIGESSVFVDQPPVRAAMMGKILVLDGIENAERNVLPTLNNLLENREMSLEDGRYLMPSQDTNLGIYMITFTQYTL